MTHRYDWSAAEVGDSYAPDFPAQLATALDTIGVTLESEIDRVDDKIDTGGEDYDTATYNTDAGGEVAIAHDLGTTPDHILVTVHGNVGMIGEPFHVLVGAADSVQWNMIVQIWDTDHWEAYDGNITITWRAWLDPVSS